MRTAQDIINVARFDLATTIVTLMRRIDAYLETGNKRLMTAADESVTIDFDECVSTPAIRIGSDEHRPLKFISTGDDHNFFVSTDDTDIDADDIPTDELLVIAKVLEDTFNAES